MVAAGETLKGRSFTRVADWSRDELESVLDLADELKELRGRREEHPPLPVRQRGLEFVAATPAAYRPAEQVVELAREAGGNVELTDDPCEAARGANVLYTDVWTSMGQDAERGQRLRDLAGYGIDAGLLGLAGE